MYPHTNTVGPRGLTDWHWPVCRPYRNEIFAQFKSGRRTKSAAAYLLRYIGGNSTHTYTMPVANAFRFDLWGRFGWPTTAAVHTHNGAPRKRDSPRAAAPSARPGSNNSRPRSVFLLHNVHRRVYTYYYCIVTLYIVLLSCKNVVVRPRTDELTENIYNPFPNLINHWSRSGYIKLPFPRTYSIQ